MVDIKDDNLPSNEVQSPKWFFQESLPSFPYVFSLSTIWPRKWLPVHIAQRHWIAVVLEVCRGIHYLRKCPRFLELSAEKRLCAVLINKYCANSLAHEHSQGNCRSRDRCETCNWNHHTLRVVVADKAIKLEVVYKIEPNVRIRTSIRTISEKITVEKLRDLPLADDRFQRLASADLYP